MGTPSTDATEDAPTPGGVAEALLAVMGRIRRFTLGRVFDNLTDDEFFWEPAPGSWSVRRREDCLTAHPFGVGEWVVDFELPEPDPVPIATIAWLCWHMGSMAERLTETEPFGGPHPVASGWTAPYLAHHPIFTTADDAVAAIRRGFNALRRGRRGDQRRRLRSHHALVLLHGRRTARQPAPGGPSRTRAVAQRHRRRHPHRGRPPRQPDLHPARPLRPPPPVGPGHRFARLRGMGTPIIDATDEHR